MNDIKMSNWQRAVDNLLVTRELGVANDEDSLEECTRKLNMLIDYEIELQALIDAEPIDEYHWDSNRNDWYYDEQGERIPLSVCLCAAREPSECGCDCNSWGNYKDWSDFG